MKIHNAKSKDSDQAAGIQSQILFIFLSLSLLTIMAGQMDNLAFKPSTKASLEFLSVQT